MIYAIEKKVTLASWSLGFKSHVNILLTICYILPALNSIHVLRNVLIIVPEYSFSVLVLTFIHSFVLVLALALGEFGNLVLVLPLVVRSRGLVLVLGSMYLH